VRAREGHPVSARRRGAARPPSALAELAARAPTAEADYILRVSEYDFTERFLSIARPGSDETELGRAVHSKHFTVFVRMSR